ncbi:phage portal protein [Crossiella sp. SN42]|uniref:phage portal protein n=1 Tax=Crossiella sp. SN42 TaxID=2944808 RepID=UPI00207C82D6|nr:phage portal protein [Crossiella sp. SN42]MCO1575019.1 phage portal protein [Crossiella sp. SN42]
MALPQPGIPWPPPAFASVLDRMAEHDAWYCGDPDRLSRIYRNRSINNHPANRPSQYRGGVVGGLARWWWGEPTPPGEKRTKLHLPLASDIATGSSDLLFAEPPKITFEDSATQDRFDELADELNLHAILSEAGEVGAALSGYYLRATVAPDLADHPLLTAVHPDAALPEFAYGMLTAVTFWWVIQEDSQTRYRHVERHELAGRQGVVLHGLYKGTADNLGQQVTLDQHEATKDLPEVWESGVDGLMVSYTPNIRPNRRDRGSLQGRSDLDGIEGVMDALDETATSWMRDVRLAKARIFIPSAYLDSQGPGAGALFDPDREAYETLSIPPTAGQGLTLNQFAIRVQEHKDTAEFLMLRGVEGAGYSGKSFGLGGSNGGTQTATEIRAEERKSFITRGKKILYVKAGLRHIVPVLLDLDRVHFNGRAERAVPSIEFPDGITDSPLQLAQTLQALRAAEAASTETLVRSQNPDWDDLRVDQEVEAILKETGRFQPVEDPDTFTGTRPQITAGTPGRPPADEDDAEQDGPPSGE